jgi:hypothetical protein
MKTVFTRCPSHPVFTVIPTGCLIGSSSHIRLKLSKLDQRTLEAIRQDFGDSGADKE